MKIKLSDIEDAFLFVSAAPRHTNDAYISKKTGEIFYLSPYDDFGLETPDEEALEGDDYVAVPHKHELDLGKDLVRRFMQDKSERLQQKVDEAFRRKGAYARYKDILSDAGLLEAWYAFENTNEQEAILQWCKENELDVDVN